jgi:hypothetical protein
MRVKLPKSSVIMPYSWSCRFEVFLRQPDKPITILSNLLHLLKAMDLIDLASSGSQFVLAGLLDGVRLLTRLFNFKPIDNNRRRRNGHWWFDCEHIGTARFSSSNYAAMLCFNHP